MTNNHLATYGSPELENVDPTQMQVYAQERFAYIGYQLSIAREAMTRAQSLNMFVIRDDQDVPDAHVALREAEAAICEANDYLNDLSVNSEKFGQFAVGMLAICQELGEQRNATLEELEVLNQTFERKVREQVEERLDEALLNNIATAEELEAESIRSMAQEFIELDFDFDSVAAERRDELERTLKAAWELATRSRPDLWEMSLDGDAGAAAD